MGYVAVVSNDEFGEVNGSDFSDAGGRGGSRGAGMVSRKGRGDAVEIWDVRRGWITKWAVGGLAGEGGIGERSLPYSLSPFIHLICSNIAFGDSHTMWAQDSSGMFTQLDLRHSFKPIDSILHASVAWEAAGVLAFVCGRWGRWEVPFDDVYDSSSSFSIVISVKFI